MNVMPASRLKEASYSSERLPEKPVVEYLMYVWKFLGSRSPTLALAIISLRETLISVSIPAFFWFLIFWNIS